MSYPPPPGYYPPPPGYFRPPSPPDPVPAGMIVGLLAGGCLVPIVGPVVALVYGISHLRRPGAPLLLAGGLVFGVIHLFLTLTVALAIPNFLHVRAHANEAAVKAGGHEIQLAVERFGYDHAGLYPSSIDELVKGGYLAQLPINPFTDQPMRQIQPGDTPFSGEFTYTPVSAEGKISGYRLDLYGSAQSKPDPRAPQRPEHVILELTEGEDR
jgi:hypothetical protein